MARAENVKKRWLEGKGLSTKASLLNSKFDIAAIPNLEIHNGRLDLRGLSLPDEFEVCNRTFEKIDFSEGFFSESIWERCRFVDCVFEKVKLDNSRFWSCHFYNSIFQNCSLKDSLLNGTLGDDTGSFINVSFLKTDLRGTVYSAPLFQNCLFDNAKLNKVDFDGSRFENCRFRGVLSETTFRGREGEKNRPDFKVRPNRMINVDFREAKMEAVIFIDDIDISSCLFPEGEEYLLIKKNRTKIFQQAKEEIERDWTGLQKKIGLTLLEHLYLSPRFKNVQAEFVDKPSLMETDAEFGERFFSMLKNLKSKFE